MASKEAFPGYIGGMTAQQFSFCGRNLALVVLWLMGSACTAAVPRAEEPDVAEASLLGQTSPVDSGRAAVEEVLDDWHLAASEVDAARYLAHLSADARFLGTDAGERWNRETFVSYVNHYFVGQKRGWTYHPRDRHIDVSSDGNVAWFDELLDNDGYGELRGTGVLRRVGDVWRISQYSMTFTVPNEVGREVAGRIRDYKEGSPLEASTKR